MWTVPVGRCGRDGGAVGVIKVGIVEGIGLRWVIGKSLGVLFIRLVRGF